MQLYLSFQFAETSDVNIRMELALLEVAQWNIEKTWTSQTPRPPRRSHLGDRILGCLASVCHGSDTNKVPVVLRSLQNAGIAARMEHKMCPLVPMQCTHFLR